MTMCIKMTNTIFAPFIGNAICTINQPLVHFIARNAERNMRGNTTMYSILCHGHEILFCIDYRHIQGTSLLRLRGSNIVAIS